MQNKINGGGEPIVLIDNGSEPTSSVIMPCLLTKSLRGLAVVHIWQHKLNGGWFPPSRRLI